MSKENITDNKPAAEPRFKVGDVVWSATTMLENDNPVFMKSKILALYYIRANGKSIFSGYKIDNILAPKAKEIMESLKDLGELAGEESNEEEE